MVSHLETMIDANYRNPWGNLEVLSTHTFLGFPMPFLHEYCQYWYVGLARDSNHATNQVCYEPTYIYKPELEDFLRRLFSDQEEQLDTKLHRYVQAKLFEIFRESESDSERIMAEGSLRCYISLTIKLACQSRNITKHIKYGRDHGFSQNDIYCCSLGSREDFRIRYSTQKQKKYSSLKLQFNILKKFPSEDEQILNGCTRTLRDYTIISAQNHIKDFLRHEHQYFVKSKYTILSRLTTSKLKKILENSSLDEEEKFDYICLIQIYQKHYKFYKKPGSKWNAIPIAFRELIISELQKSNITRWSQQDLESLIDKIEKCWRENKKNEKGMSSELEHINPMDWKLTNLTQPSIEYNGFNHEESLVFINSIIRNIIRDVIPRNAPTNNKKKQRFWKALCLFTCHEKSQREIAELLEISDQSGVSNFLKFKQICGDIISGTVASSIAFSNKDMKTKSDLIEIYSKIEHFLGNPTKYAFTPKKKRDGCRLFKMICQYLQEEHPDICEKNY